MWIINVNGQKAGREPLCCFRSAPLPARRRRRAGLIFCEMTLSCMRSNEMYDSLSPSQPQQESLPVKPQVDRLWRNGWHRSPGENPYISFDLKQELGHFAKMSMYDYCFRPSNTISPNNGRNLELCVHYTCGQETAQPATSRLPGKTRDRFYPNKAIYGK